MSEEVEYEAQNNNQANQASNPELQAQPKNLKKKEMIKKLQIEELDQENNIFEDSKQESLTRKCAKHPEEELQFYCFNKEQLLCSECLVSGKYVGLDVANLRKAAGKLREKFKKFVSDAVEKFEVYNALEEEIQSHEEGVESAVSAYEEEILKSFNQIRQKINEKEQEIVNNLLILKQERVKELKSAAIFIQSYQQEIESLKNVVEDELKTLDELSLCKYYQQKTDAMQTLLNKEIKTESIKEIIEHQQLQDQLGLSKLQEDCKAIQAQVEALSGIGTGKTKQNNKEGNKLGRVGSLFSSLENDSNTLQESRDTLLFRPSTPSRSTISHKPTYLPEDLVKATSMPSSTNNIFEKHIAKVQEIRRQTPKQDIRIDTSILAPEGKKPEARNSLMIEMKRNTVNKKYSGLSLNDSASILDVYKEGRNKISESKTPKTFMLSSNISPSNKTFGAELSSPNHFKSNSFLTSVTTKAADKPEKIGFDSSIRYMKLDRSLYELQNAELQRKNSAKPITRESDDSIGLNMEKMFAKRKAQERGSISSGNHTEMKKRLSNLGSSLFK